MLLRFVLGLVNHDGPVERTGGDARNKVQQVRPDEAPRGARESTRTSSDGVLFHNRDDILRRSAASNNICEDDVSVRRREGTGPEGVMGQEINLELVGQGKATKMGSFSRPAPINEAFGELEVGDFNSLDRAAKGYLGRCRRRAGKRRCQQ